jgi:hypothetical protein
MITGWQEGGKIDQGEDFFNVIKQTRHWRRLFVVCDTKYERLNTLRVLGTAREERERKGQEWHNNDTLVV